MFDIEYMGLRLESQAPLLWSLIGSLLSSDPSHDKRRAEYVMGENITEHHNEHVPWDEEDEYWAQLDEQEDAHGSSAADEGNERRRKRRHQVGKRTFALWRIVRDTYANTCP